MPRRHPTRAATCVSDKVAVEQFKYNPAVLSENGQKLMLTQLQNTRTNGQRYSGNVSEIKMIQDAAAIYTSSIASVTVGDVLFVVFIGALKITPPAPFP